MHVSLQQYRTQLVEFPHAAVVFTCRQNHDGDQGHPLHQLRLRHLCQRQMHWRSFLQGGSDLPGSLLAVQLVCLSGKDCRVGSVPAWRVNGTAGCAPVARPQLWYTVIVWGRQRSDVSSECQVLSLRCGPCTRISFLALASNPEVQHIHTRHYTHGLLKPEEKRHARVAAYMSGWTRTAVLCATLPPPNLSAPTSLPAIPTGGGLMMSAAGKSLSLVGSTGRSG